MFWCSRVCGHNKFNTQCSSKVIFDFQFTECFAKKVNAQHLLIKVSIDQSQRYTVIIVVLYYYSFLFSWFRNIYCVIAYQWQILIYKPSQIRLKSRQVCLKLAKYNPQFISCLDFFKKHFWRTRNVGREKKTNNFQIFRKGEKKS